MFLKTTQLRSTKAVSLGRWISVLPEKKADSEATREQDWIQHSGGAGRGYELPPPPADLFIAAGAIVAERAARGGASRGRVEDIIRRAVDQASALRGATA